MREKTERICLECGKPIIAGRTDRVYCDDICRARATRQRNKEKAAEGYEDRHKAVIRILKRNYSLLKKAIGDREEWIVDLAPLYFKGFDRLFYTGSEPLANRGTRYYCFELGWEDQDDGRLRVTVDLNRLKTFDPAELNQVRFKQDDEED